MPSIHETIESDESFSSFSDLEDENNAKSHDGASQSNSTTNTSQQQQQQQPSPVPHEESNKGTSSVNEPSPAIAQVLVPSSGGSKEGRILVGYSDVSSEEFSEPEAGEITDSPERTPPTHKKVPKTVRYPALPSPRRIHSPPTVSYPKHSPPPLSPPPHKSPASYPKSPLPLSDGEVTSGVPIGPISPDRRQLTSRGSSLSSGSGGIPPHSLVPYSANMSPDRRNHDVRGSDYYAASTSRGSLPPREPAYHPLADSERDPRPRKKDHRDKKHKKREKKRKRMERSHSPPTYPHKKKRKKNKYKSRSGSPNYIGSEDDESNSSENDVMEIRYGGTGKSNIRDARGETNRPRDASPVSSNSEDLLSPRHQSNHSRGTGLEFRQTVSHPRGRDRPSPRRTPPLPHSPPPPRHHRHNSPIGGSNRLGGRSGPQSPPPQSRRNASPGRRQSGVSPRKASHRSGPHSPPHPPSIRKRSGSPTHFVEIGDESESPGHYRHYPPQQSGSSARKDKRRKKKDKDREYAHSGRMRSRSKSRSHSRSRSRGKSPRYIKYFFIY